MTIKAPSSQALSLYLGSFHTNPKIAARKTVQNGHFTPLKVDHWPNNSPCQALSCFLHSFSSVHSLPSYLFTLFNDGALCLKREQRCMIIGSKAKKGKWKICVIFTDHISHCRLIHELCLEWKYFMILLFTIPSLRLCQRSAIGETALKTMSVWTGQVYFTHH